MKQMVAILLVCFITGCYNAKNYKGNGKFVDNGRSAAIDRYVLMLAPIDIANRNKKEYTLWGLPSVMMVFGFDIRPIKKEDLSEWDDVKMKYPIRTKVKVELLNDKGEIVIKEQGFINEWKWGSFSNTDGAIDNERRMFVYQKGKEEMVDLGNTTYTYKRVGVLADGGWGTYFTPKTEMKYTLTVEVVEEDLKAENYTVVPTVKGGGWK